MLRYKDSWNSEIKEHVNSFFASVLLVEKFLEMIANLKFPVVGQIPEKLFKLKCQQNILEIKQQKK